MVKRLVLLVVISITAIGFTGAQIPDISPAPIPLGGNNFITKPKTLTPESIPEFLQDISVTIRCGNGEEGHSYGSGIIKTRDGVHFILTCAHAVSSLKSQEGEKWVFEDAQVLKDIIDEDGRTVGLSVYDAEVMAYSDKEDLAILRVRKKNVFDKSVVFSKNSARLPIGTELFHVGSFHGIKGSGSFSTGVISKNGRVRTNVLYDQSSCTIFPGSSGGGLYLKKNGEYVGMVVRAAGETYNLFVPLRRIEAWLEKVGGNFILDDEIPVPKDFASKALDTETYKVDTQFDKEYPVLLKKIGK